MRDTLWVCQRKEESCDMIKGRDQVYDYFSKKKVLDEYEGLIWRLRNKLQIIDELLREEAGRMIISYVTSRVKTPESIIDKLERKDKKVSAESALDNLNDIVGVRAVCLFQDDIYHIRDFLYKQPDVEVLKEKDFIKKPKASGYRSLHLILKMDGVKIELQLRTPAMDFWSVLEYQLQYKKKNAKVKAEEAELKSCAEAIEAIEERMGKLRSRIEEA